MYQPLYMCAYEEPQIPVTTEQQGIWESFYQSSIDDPIHIAPILASLPDDENFISSNSASIL
jgi:hypothetical protein